MKDELRRLAGHMWWADQRVLSGLRSAGGSDPAASEYFAHVVAVEHLWLARIRGQLAEIAVWPNLSLDECEALAAKNRQELDALLATVSEADLSRDVSYRNSAGDAFTSRLDDILLHVAMHGSYHRGQVSLMIRRSGGTPVPTDYIAFVRGAPAATRTDNERSG